MFHYIALVLAFRFLDARVLYSIVQRTNKQVRACVLKAAREMPEFNILREIGTERRNLKAFIKHVIFNRKYEEQAIKGTLDISVLVDSRPTVVFQIFSELVPYFNVSNPHACSIVLLWVELLRTRFEDVDKKYMTELKSLISYIFNNREFDRSDKSQYTFKVYTGYFTGKVRQPRTKIPVDNLHTIIKYKYP
jgi:hypothetical protein